ncbi:MAG: hypothetical protein ACKO3N_03630 [Verrucomicrobiota bacterium]
MKTQPKHPSCLYSRTPADRRITEGEITVHSGPSMSRPGTWSTIVRWPAGMSNFPDLFRATTQAEALRKADEITRRYHLERV